MWFYHQSRTSTYFDIEYTIFDIMHDKYSYNSETFMHFEDGKTFLF
jgi:hypothetical protein